MRLFKLGLSLSFLAFPRIAFGINGLDLSLARQSLAYHLDTNGKRDTRSSPTTCGDIERFRFSPMSVAGSQMMN